jgi:hypothetical protein
MEGRELHLGTLIASVHTLKMENNTDVVKKRRMDAVVHPAGAMRAHESMPSARVDLRLCLQSFDGLELC